MRLIRFVSTLGLAAVLLVSMGATTGLAAPTEQVPPGWVVVQQPPQGGLGRVVVGGRFGIVVALLGQHAQVELHLGQGDELPAVGRVVAGQPGPQIRRPAEVPAGRLPLPAVVVVRAEGVERILVTCDDDNAASIVIIEKAGGVLDDVRLAPDGTPRRRYWLM